MANLYPKTQTIEINEIYIESSEWNLKPYFLVCHIYEDVFNHFMTGSVVTLDNQAMTEKIPITGWQDLVITFKSNPDGPFITWTKKFKIYKMNSIVNDPNGQQVRMITLHFISAPAHEDLSKRISRSYMGMTQDQIVNNVATSVLGVPAIDCEGAKYPKNLIIPNWKPTQVIDYCSQTAIRASGYEAANFMFFETIDTFKFVSMDSLVEQGADGTPITHETTFNTWHDGNMSDTRQAKSYTTTGNFDFLKNSNRGAWAKRFSGLDITSKKWKNFDYSYNADFGAMPKLDGGQILTENVIDAPEQNMQFGQWQSKPRGYNSDYNMKHLHKRSGHMQLWDNISYSAEVSGDTRVKLGTKIPFNLPSYDGSSDQPGLDSQVSGNHIVTQIHHIFSSTEHNQILGLKKNMLKG